MLVQPQESLIQSEFVRAQETIFFKLSREFPGGPVVRTLRSHCHGPRLDPGQGTKISQATVSKVKIN